MVTLTLQEFYNYFPFLDVNKISLTNIEKFALIPRIYKTEQNIY